MGRLFLFLIACYAASSVRCQTDPGDLCGVTLENCYEDEVRQLLQHMQDLFHSNIGALCNDLRNASFARCSDASEVCTAKNPWEYPVKFFTEGLCTEENIKLFSTPLVPADQCFHINFTLACIARRVTNYNTLTEFLISHKNNETCRRIVGSVSECITATFTACPNPEKLRSIHQALLALAFHTLTISGCDVHALSHGADTDTMAKQSECDVQMTWVQNCVKTITNPTTVPNHLLQKAYLTHDSSVEEFCKDFRDILDCKRNLTTGGCYNEVTRAALARNIYAFSKARDFLCENNAANLKVFKEALTSDNCQYNEDALEDCSREFVTTVTSTDASEDNVNRAFKEQVRCIKKEIESCKDVSLQSISESFVDTAAAAFTALTNRTKSSDATTQRLSIYPAITLLVATGLSVSRF